MTKSTKGSISDQNNFICNLIDMTARKDKELKEFIDKNLFPMNSKSNSIEIIYRNINALKEMEPNQQLLVKGRAKHFEETNDPSKYFPALISMIAIFLTVFALINSIAINKNGFMNIVLFFIVLLFLILLFIVWRLYFNSVRMRSSAVYFNSLVTNIKYNKV